MSGMQQTTPAAAPVPRASDSSALSAPPTLPQLTLPRSPLTNQPISPAEAQTLVSQVFGHFSYRTPISTAAATEQLNGLSRVIGGDPESIWASNRSAIRKSYLWGLTTPVDPVILSGWGLPGHDLTPAEREHNKGLRDRVAAAIRSALPKSSSRDPVLPNRTTHDVREGFTWHRHENNKELPPIPKGGRCPFRCSSIGAKGRSLNSAVFRGCWTINLVDGSWTRHAQVEVCLDCFAFNLLCGLLGTCTVKRPGPHGPSMSAGDELHKRLRADAGFPQLQAPPGVPQLQTTPGVPSALPRAVPTPVPPPTFTPPAIAKTAGAPPSRPYPHSAEPRSYPPPSKAEAAGTCNVFRAVELIKACAKGDRFEYLLAEQQAMAAAFLMEHMRRAGVATLRTDEVESLSQPCLLCLRLTSLGHAVCMAAVVGRSTRRWNPALVMVESMYTPAMRGVTLEVHHKCLDLLLYGTTFDLTQADGARSFDAAIKVAEVSKSFGLKSDQLRQGVRLGERDVAAHELAPACACALDIGDDLDGLAQAVCHLIYLDQVCRRSFCWLREVTPKDLDELAGEETGLQEDLDGDAALAAETLDGDGTDADHEACG